MLWLICYDIADNKRRYRVDKTLKGYGIRAQKSLFECHLSHKKRKQLEWRLAKIVDEQEDSVRFYRLCGNDAVRVLVQGMGEKPDDWDYMVV